MKILAIADEVSPIVYSENFPKNLPPFDLVLSAGDMPGHVLEYVATKLTIQPLFVLGNHGNGYLNDPFTGETKLPGGCINLHRKVIKFGDVIIAGVEGSARYRPGDLQYSEFEMDVFTQLMTPRLLHNRWRHGRAVDILLTHAPPKGPHEGSDFPHRGVPAFNRFAKRWKPKLHVHGHVHLNGVNAPRSYVTDIGMQVVNAFRFTLIDLDLDNPEHKRRPSHL
ncbi:MAG: metallophosphoesterase [Deinococcota bacterium]